MIQKSVTIVNKLGLHARASAKLVACASRYSSKIELSIDNNKVNAKSIMGVMMLGAAKGAVIVLQVHGDDEADALTAIETLIADRFGEAE